MAKHQALWADVKRDLNAAESCCTMAVARADSLEIPDQLTDNDIRFDRELAIGTLLHDCYSAMEAVLERLVDAIDGDRPKGGDYHAQLIQRAATDITGLRPPMIAAQTTRDLQALRSFRHTMRHSYGAFDYGRARPNVEIARRAVAKFREEITAFAKVMNILPGGQSEAARE